MPGSRRIAVLTGGGDCPGLNAVIRAVTKSALLQGFEVLGVLEGFGGLVNGAFITLGEDDVSGILPRGGTILGTSNKDDPYRFRAKTTNGGTVYSDRSPDVLRNLEEMGIDALIVAGGDGSLTIALKLLRQGVNVVGIPKTIDNDLEETDVTFGFDSALCTATGAVDKLHTTAEAHHRIMVLEVMGREAGWLALMSGVAGGGDIVLIPEIPFTFEIAAASIRTRFEKGKRFSIVVVAEGARLPDGSQVSRETVSGSTVLGGVGHVIARELEALTGIESRITVLGHLQRGGSPTAFDRVLATRFGVKAVELVAAGEYGRMVNLKGREIGSVLIEQAVARQRTVPPGGGTVRAAREIGMSFGDA